MITQHISSKSVTNNMEWASYDFGLLHAYVIRAFILESWNSVDE